MKKENEISLIEIYVKVVDDLKLLWSKKLTLIIAGVIGGLIGLTFALSKPIEYKSKLTFILDEGSSSGNLSALSGIASSFGFDGAGGEGGLYSNQINLMNYLKSRSIIETVLISKIGDSEKTFADNFIEAHGWNESWDEDSILKKIDFSAPRSNFTLQQDSILFKIYDHVKNEVFHVSKIDDDGGIILINTQSLNESFAKFFPEKLLTIVSNKYTETKIKKDLQNVTLLKHQTDSVRSCLNHSLLNVAQQTDNTFGLNPSMNTKRVGAAKERIDIETSTILLGELIKNLELSKMQLKNKTPVIELIDRPIFPLEEEKVSKIKAIILGGFLTDFLTILFILIRVRFQKLQLAVNHKVKINKSIK